MDWKEVFIQAMRTFVEASVVERPDEAAVQSSRQHNELAAAKSDKHAGSRSSVKRTPQNR